MNNKILFGMCMFLLALSPAYAELGVDWTETTTNADWSARNFHQVLTFDNKMWVIGGDDGTKLNDVWYSTDGITWTEATASASWSSRHLHQAIVYDNKMWVIGGTNGTKLNDVWYSTDGITWTEATASASWSSRHLHQAIVYDNKMWVIGGTNGTKLNDVWYSTDGITWTEATASASWSSRHLHQAIVYDNKMWVIGGTNGTKLNDVWYSTDGITWTEATASASWSSRHLHQAIVYDNKMWVIGGTNGTKLNDVWYSEIGNSAPVITINNPTNTTYYTTSIPLNVTVSDLDSASFWCAIYNDGVLVTNQTTNTTYTTTLTKTYGSHNVSVHCEDAETTTSDDAEYYYVFMGLNVSAFNGGNASALTSWNIYATNGTFNYSDTGLSNPTLIDIANLPTGSTNITFEKTGFKNATYTRTLNNSALVQLDGNLFYNQLFYAKDVDTSASLSDFQISFTNGTATYSDIAVGTTINIPLDELPYGTVDVTVEKIGYGTNTTQIEINGNSTIAYTTYLKKSGLYVTAKDEETYNALTFNITISNSTTSQTWTNQTIYNQQYEDIPTGSITITVKSTDYAQRTYFGTMTEYTALTFSAYLLKETTGHDVSIIILNQNDIPMQTATVTATKFISGAWVTVEQGETDSSGTTSLFLDRYTQYKIKITHGDIITFYRTLTPSANSYTFRVSGQIELNFYNLFEGISYSIIPVQNSILTELTNLSYTVSSATGELEYFGYVVEDNDHNVLGSAVIDSSPGGAEMIYNLDISVLNYSVGDNIYFYTYFKRADTDEATYSRYYVNKTYVIWIYTDSNTTIVDALDQFSSENSGELVMLLIATMIMAVSLGGLGMMVQRVDVAMLVALMELGIFTMIGWIPFFAGSVAGLFGVLILFSFVRSG